MVATKKKKAAPKKAAETKKVKNNAHKSDTMAKEDNKLMLLIAYILGVFAIIIYLMKKEDSFVKFHSLQSVVLSILAFVYLFGLGILGFVLGIVSAPIGGICGFITLPLSALPFLLYIYILFKVITTGDVEVPYLTAFVKKNMKQYF